MQAPVLNGLASVDEPAAKWSKLRGKRILLAEDQPSVREAVSLLLSLDEHTVIEASNGVEALELFRQDQFDLVITDFEMPKMKGNELAARIKQRCPTQPILMITAYAEKLGNSGNPVDTILDKPFQLEDLRRAMAKLLS